MEKVKNIYFVPTAQRDLLSDYASGLIIELENGNKFIHVSMESLDPWALFTGELPNVDVYENQNISTLPHIIPPKTKVPITESIIDRSFKIPQIVKWYLVKLETTTGVRSGLVTAESPDEAYEKVSKQDTKRIIDIKLVETIEKFNFKNND